MKVLMFGWEFPPHISGGLGTACYGLTRALSKNDVDILFVVPRLRGGESADCTTFINASDIPIATHQNPLELFPPATLEPSVRHELINVIKPEREVRTIAVPSALSPYQSPSYAPGYTVENWNYTMDQVLRSSPSSISRTVAATTQDPLPGKPQPYAFTGAYGDNLFEEVRRYAQVGAEVARRSSFDVIHAHDWMTYLAGIAAKKISGKPLVVHVHATEYDRSGEHVHRGVFAIEKQGLTEADCIVTVSHWTKNIAVSKYGVPPEKIEVVHNGIQPATESVAVAGPPKFGRNIVTFLGRVTHQKGPLYFVEAARLVNEHMPGTHFVVAGAGDMLPIMIERIAQLKMSSCFHFTGFLKGADLKKVWSMSSVYVMPSVSEPFGIAPLEAIQAGVPVIISNQSGVSEVMPHAIKVDFWNVRALAASICSVLKYKSLSKTLTRNGAEEIHHISWNKAAEKITKLYYELATEQRHP